MLPRPQTKQQALGHGAGLVAVHRPRRAARRWATRFAALAAWVARYWRAAKPQGGSVRAACAVASPGRRLACSAASIITFRYLHGAFPAVSFGTPALTDADSAGAQ
jgi:hypothetical protein